VPIVLTGQVGPQVVQDGATPPSRQGRTAELVVTELHGKYYESNYRRNLFSMAGTAGVVAPVYTATASVACAFQNPAGSGVNCSMVRVECLVTADPATPVVGGLVLAGNGNPVGTAVTGTALVAQSGLLGSGSQPRALGFSTAALPAAPVLLRVLAEKQTGAATTIPFLQTFAVDLDGSLILAPGAYIVIGTFAVDTTDAAVLPVFVWEEIPI
jgi:hypothetical protein